MPLGSKKYESLFCSACTINTVLIRKAESFLRVIGIHKQRFHNRRQTTVDSFFSSLISYKANRFLTHSSFMEFEYNRIEDLIFSPTFGAWVLSKNSHENKFWIEWENRNSHKIKMINTAKATIHALQINFDIMPEKEVNDEISKLMSVIINLNSGKGYKCK